MNILPKKIFSRKIYRFNSKLHNVINDALKKNRKIVITVTNDNDGIVNINNNIDGVYACYAQRRKQEFEKLLNDIYFDVEGCINQFSDDYYVNVITSPLENITDVDITSFKN